MLDVRKPHHVGFSVALLVLIAFAGHAIWNLQDLLDRGALRAAAHERLDFLDELLETLLDEETGSRGFAATADPTFLESYERSRALLPSRATRVCILGADRGDAPSKECGLAREIAEHSAFLARQIESTRSRGVDAGRDLMATGEGKRRMDAIRASLQALRRVELDDLRRQERTYRARAWRATGWLVAGSLLAFLLVLGSWYLFHRQSLRRQRAEAKVAELAAEALQRAAMLDRILENTPTYVWLYDREGRILFASPKALEVLGLTAEQTLGKRVDELGLEPAVVEPFTRGFRQIRETRAACTLLVEQTTQIGLRWYEFALTPLGEREEYEGRVLSTVNDVTEREREKERLHRVQAALQEGLRVSEDVVHAVLDAAPVAILTLDAEGKVRFWNPAAQRIFGWSAAEAKGRIPPFVADEQRDEFAGLLRRVLAGESFRGLELTRWCKDGRSIEIALSTAQLTDSEGKAGGVLALVEDITDRKRADARLRAQLARLDLLNRITRAIASRQDSASIVRVVLDSVERDLPTDGVWLLEPSPDRVSVRVAATGAHADAISGASGLAEGASLDVGENGLRACLHGQTVSESDIAALRTSAFGALQRVSLRAVVAVPLAHESRVSGVLLAARQAPASFESGDAEFLRQLAEHVALALEHQEILTSLKHANQELLATQEAVLQQERLRAMGQMASGIAHDINNALGPITLYADSLLQDASCQGDRAQKYLGVIQMSADSIARTVSRMREFYRKREDGHALENVFVDALLRQVVDLARPRWHDMPLEHGVRVAVQVECEPDLPPLACREADLRDAIVNLVFNAVDALPNGGHVVLRAKRLEGRERPTLCLEVEDNGTGMDADARGRCLEPFFTTKGERGTGLGLSMVFGAAKRHDGELEIDSEPGRGTTVRLLLPLRERVERVERDVGKERVDPLRVLCIDDDSHVLHSVREVLRADGHTVQAEEDGASGIAAFMAALDGADPFDLVVTDLGMPGMDGRDVARRIKERAPGTPVILLTGWGEGMSADETRPPNVDLVLSKPARIGDLRCAFADVMLGRSV